MADLEFCFCIEGHTGRDSNRGPKGREREGLAASFNRHDSRDRYDEGPRSFVSSPSRVRGNALAA